MDALSIYLFDRDTVPLSPFVWGGIGLAAAFLLVGLIVPYISWLTSRRNKKAWTIVLVIRPFCAWLRTIGTIALLLFFLRYEAIYPFMFRIWLILLACVAIGWGAMLAKKQLSRKPLLVQGREREDRFEKYLPKPKRKA